MRVGKVAYCKMTTWILTTNADFPYLQARMLALTKGLLRKHYNFQGNLSFKHLMLLIAKWQHESWSTNAGHNNFLYLQLTMLELTKDLLRKLHNFQGTFSFKHLMLLIAKWQHEPLSTTIYTTTSDTCSWPWVWFNYTTIIWVPMCQSFSHFSAFMHHILLTKLMTSNISHKKPLFKGISEHERGKW